MKQRLYNLRRRIWREWGRDIEDTEAYLAAATLDDEKEIARDPQPDKRDACYK